MAVEYARETAALDTVVPLSPTAGSLADILSKAAGARTFDKATDSLEALREKVDTILTPVSTASATTTGVIVEDGATGTPTFATLSSHNTPDTFGTWGALDASASADSWICGFYVYCDEFYTTRYGVCIEIGTGASGSEATKTRHSLSFKTTGFVKLDETKDYVFDAYVPFVIPIKVASGTRIAGRVACGATGGKTYYMSLQMYQGLET